MGVIGSTPVNLPTLPSSDEAQLKSNSSCVTSLDSRSDVLESDQVSEQSISFETSSVLESIRAESSDLNSIVRSGFLPSLPPLCRLEFSPCSVWEEALDAAKGLELGQGESNELTRRWRRMIRDDLQLVPITSLSHDLRALRRAHSVLAFLMHFYIFSDRVLDDQPASAPPSPHLLIPLVPKSIAVPLCAICKILDLPPVLTYADTVLYNWRLIDPAHGFTPDNIVMQTTFTGTRSEEHFYKTSVLVEVMGTACLSLMRVVVDEAVIADSLSITRMAASLVILSKLIDRLTDIVERVRDHCDPAEFYWKIRPWFHGGSREMEGVVDPQAPSEAQASPWLVSDFGGPSAGQSTLIHALDVFLGVDHRPHPHPHPSKTSGNSSSSSTTSNNLSSLASPDKLDRPGGEETFMTRMAAYMPYHHRRFLTELADSLNQSSRTTTFPSLPKVATYSVRSLALALPSTSDLRMGYNECVNALGRLRSTHNRIALLYIITQSRLPPPDGSAFLESWNRKMVAEEAERNQKRMSSGGGSPSTPTMHLGTGGTDLAKFLKRCRQRTSDALLD